MKSHSKFLQDAHAHLDTLGKELDELETKVAQAGKAADTWSTVQVGKLKQDWEDAKSEMGQIASRIETEGEASVEEARANAERHWEALRAAVQTYRSHLETSVAS